MNNYQKKTPPVTTGAWIRLIVLLVMVANAILLMFGKQALPVGEADVEFAVNWVYAAVSSIGAAIAIFVAWWKDNDFTTWARFNRKPKNK